MDIKITQKLFSSLIQKPILTDKLLERPPFKFLHDVITETIRVSGFLNGFFTNDELDVEKTSSLKELKIFFLQKLIDILNVDGSLDQVKPVKIVAGKEPENTNFLLQKFASEATSHLLTSNNNHSINNNKELTNEPKKNISKISKESSKSTKEKSRSKNNVESAPLKIVNKITDSKKLSKFDNAKTEGAVSKSRTKSRDSSKVGERKKEKKTKSSKSKENLQTNINVDEGVSSPHNFSPNIHGELGSGQTFPKRESSGGTSKGGDDSGIADETGAESERHDSESLKSQNFLDNKKHFNDKTNNVDLSMSTIKQDSVLIRPTTGIGLRPQTSMGRPGTAIARAAPPKLKKTKVVDINILEVSAQPVATNTSLIMESDQISKNNDADEFLIEENDDCILRSANISLLNEGVDHGTLVNKIIENTRELEKDNLLSDYSDSTIDFHEQRRIKNEIENIQKSLQNTTQNIQPLARTLEHITNDFDLNLKEIEESRKITVSCMQMIEDHSKNSADSVFALSAALRNLENDIREIRQQIANAITNVISNDKFIEIQLCGE